MSTTTRTTQRKRLPAVTVGDVNSKSSIGVNLYTHFLQLNATNTEDPAATPPVSHTLYLGIQEGGAGPIKPYGMASGYTLPAGAGDGVLQDSRDLTLNPSDKLFLWVEANGGGKLIVHPIVAEDQ